MQKCLQLQTIINDTNSLILPEGKRKATASGSGMPAKRRRMEERPCTGLAGGSPISRQHQSWLDAEMLAESRRDRNQRRADLVSKAQTSGTPRITSSISPNAIEELENLIRLDCLPDVCSFAQTEERPCTWDLSDCRNSVLHGSCLGLCKTHKQARLRSYAFGLSNPPWKRRTQEEAAQCELVAALATHAPHTASSDAERLQRRIDQRSTRCVVDGCTAHRKAHAMCPRHYKFSRRANPKT